MKKADKTIDISRLYGVYSVDALEIFCLASSVLTVFKGLFLLRIYCRRSEKCGDYRYASGHEYRA